ncbi:MAG: hypothetical protein P1U86_17550 [Verrucomicrobiales bacterium]|nr:hypothetical protein [Verrucomicrobiales bacterium]
MFITASLFSMAAAVLTFFGFMHGEEIGIAHSPMVAGGYVVVTLILLGCAKFSTTSAEAPVPEEEESEAITTPTT